MEGAIHQRVSEAARIIAAFSLFVAVFIAAFLAFGYGLAFLGIRHVEYWCALGAAASATFVTVRLIEHGQWRIGFFVPPRLAAPEFALGALLGAVLIGACDLLIVGSTHIRHVLDGGFSWRDFVVVYVPAAVNEEVLFRGYVYQRLRLINRTAAILVLSVVFALLHAGNSGVTLVAIASVFGGGVLLALAYELYGRLWFPIGLHLAWNVVSGGVLGYDVSGYVGHGTLLRVTGNGPAILTGGAFGIEGSVWAVLVEVAGIAFLLRKARPRRL